jgi:hypothetical protein
MIYNMIKYNNVIKNATLPDARRIWIIQGILMRATPQSGVSASLH